MRGGGEGRRKNILIFAEHVRQTQLRLLILRYLQAVFGGQVALKTHLINLLNFLRRRDNHIQGYVLAAFIALLHLVRNHTQFLVDTAAWSTELDGVPTAQLSPAANGMM